MIIQELKVKNFQVHEERTIQFKKGLNVVVGDTNIGKSSLIRALFLLIMNQPRSSEKIFQKKFQEDPMEIQIKDDQGNIIIRKQNKYYLNGKILKAFGSDVPETIKEVLPIREINFQKQLDPHFLIMQTGGNAAKILNVTTGMEDQEALMKQIKSEILEHNTNIKALVKNTQEHRETINRLKNVNRFLMKAKAINQIKKDSMETEIVINTLKNLLNKIENCQISPKVILSIDNKLEKIKRIEVDKNDYIELEKKINKLRFICDQLIDIKLLSSKDTICNNSIKSIDSINLQLNEAKETENAINLLTNITGRIIELQIEIEDYDSQISKLYDSFNKKLIELGECPLCGSKIEERERHIC